MDEIPEGGPAKQAAPKTAAESQKNNTEQSQQSMRIARADDDQESKELARCIRRGDLIAFPTETFYAVGGNALSLTLCERVFLLKQRPRNKPLLVLAEPRQMTELVHIDEPWVKKLIERFMPGPLTLVLPVKAGSPEWLADAKGTLAVRWSSSPEVAKLIALARVPLIGTSANLSGKPENTESEEVRKEFGESLDWLIAGGSAPGGMPSTILDATSFPCKLLREGAIPTSELKEFL